MNELDRDRSTASRGCVQLAAFPEWGWSLEVGLDHYRASDPGDGADDGLAVSSREVVSA